LRAITNIYQKHQPAVNPKDLTNEELEEVIKTGFLPEKYN
jgi:hypothetical protein